MTPRGRLVCCVGAASLMFGMFCLAQKGVAHAELIPLPHQSDLTM